MRRRPRKAPKLAPQLTLGPPCNGVDVVELEAAGDVGEGVCVATESADTLVGAADRSPAIRCPMSTSWKAGLQCPEPTRLEAEHPIEPPP